MEEQPKTEHVVEAPAELTPDQQILKDYSDNLNLFIKKVSTYKGSKKQLQRVMNYLAISPLNKEPFYFSYPEEKELFELGNEVNSGKFYLLLASHEESGTITVNDIKENNNGV